MSGRAVGAGRWRSGPVGSGRWKAGRWKSVSAAGGAPGRAGSMITSRAGITDQEGRVGRTLRSCPGRQSTPTVIRQFVADHEVEARTRGRPAPWRRCQPASAAGGALACGRRRGPGPCPGEHRDQVRPANSVTACTSTSSAASEPGQRATAPRAPERAERGEHHPDDERHRSSGTGQRRAHRRAHDRHDQQRAAGGHGRERDVVPLPLNVRAMKTTSSPSSSTPLKDSVNPYQLGSDPNRRRGAEAAAASCAR